MAKLKTDKIGSYIEVEGDQEFVKEIYQDFFGKPSKPSEEDYKKVRQCILVFLLIIFIFTLVIAFLCTDKFWSKIIFGFAAGLLGLIARNITFMSGGIIEKSGKNLYWSYVAYFLFVITSSLLIFGLLNFSEKISTIPNLFYFFLLPLNFYIGLITYSAFILLNKILDKF